MTVVENALTDVVAKPSTSELIAEQLRRAILVGAIRGGEQLKQNEVAARFGVSVAPVREALQRLIADGLAVLHNNRGVTVSTISEKDFVEIAELRNLLEPHVLRLSAPHLDRSDLVESESILMKAAEATDAFERARLHWEFHRSLYKRADRPRLLSQVAGLYQSINRYLLPAWASSGLSEDWVASHLALVATIRTGDFDGACKLVIDQTDESAQRVLGHIRLEKMTEGNK